MHGTGKYTYFSTCTLKTVVWSNSANAWRITFVLKYFALWVDCKKAKMLYAGNGEQTPIEQGADTDLTGSRHRFNGEQTPTEQGADTDLTWSRHRLNREKTPIKQGTDTD